MDHLFRWLLDVTRIVAWIRWQRSREVRVAPVKPLGVGRFKKGVVAVFADPTADRTGDREGHLDRITREWRIPVILYTAMTPEVAGILLGMGHSGIRTVIFHRVDDDRDRFVDVVPWERNDHPLQAA